MFIAMNRFKVAKEACGAFEEVWRTRESFLPEMPGFIEFHMLRGPDRGDHVLYSSHTAWRTKEHFEAWTQSDAFRKAHTRSSGGDTLYLEHPQFEGFDVIQTIAPQKAAAE